MFRYSRHCRWVHHAIFTFIALTLACAALASASTLIIVRGTVFDPSGAVVRDARVEILKLGMPIATVFTDANGQYSVSLKPALDLRLRVIAAGFSNTEKVLDDVSDAREMALDVVLRIASLSEKLTVTSTGAPTPQSELGAAVSLLDAADYRGTRDIQEALRLVPGVQAIGVGQAGGSTQLYIRGGGSDANKVLLDGIPINDIGGNVEFANVSSAAIAQVEILRGPNSALYGSDALSGVVSMTTTQGSTRRPLLTYQIEGGNFGTYRQEGALGGRNKSFDYFSDFARFDTRNSVPYSTFHNGTFTGNYGWALTPTSSLRATVHHDQVASGQPSAIQLYGIPSDFKLSNEDAYFGVTWEDHRSAKWDSLIRYGGVRLRSLFTEFKPTGIPQYGPDPFDPTQIILLGYLGAPITIHGANGYSVSGQAFYQYAEKYPNYGPSSTDKDFIYAQSDYHVSPHLLGLFAFRYEDERGYSFGSANATERGNYSYTFELQGDIRNRIFYSLGSGIEDNGLFGFAATPRASLAWKVADNTKLRASFAKGIKEPLLFDQLESLYALLLLPGSQPIGSQLIAQDHIAPIGPQNSRTYDGGIDQYLLQGRSRISLTFFHNQFTNGIEYVPPLGLTTLGVPSAIVAIASSTYYGAAVNTKAYRAQGIETEIESRLRSDFFLRAGYTYIDAKIQHSFTGDAIGPSYNPQFPTVQIGVFSPLIGARPFRIAPHSGYFEAAYRYARLSAALRGTLVSRRDDSDFLQFDANGGQTMLLPNRNLDSAYQRIDLTSSYRANRHISVEGNFQNLLCEHYSEAFGYPALPFMFRLGLKFSLGGDSSLGE